MKKNKIGIISMRAMGSGTMDSKYSRLIEEAEEKGYNVNVFFADRFFLKMGKSTIDIFYNEELLDISDYKLFLTIEGCDEEKRIILEALETKGAILKNNSFSMAIARDKARTNLFLNKADIETVDCGVNFSSNFLKPLLNSWEGEDYVLKLRKGSWGKGVSYINSDLSLISNFELISSSGIAPHEILFERFIKESFGVDYRIIIAGNSFITAMKRKSNGFDFRANLFGGGSGEIFDPSRKMIDIAIKSVKAIGLDYGAVDFLESEKGPLVLEVNSNPGLKIEAITGVNVVKGIMDNIL
jgi:ribosomal protein S6--L-glutamate ligase